MRFDVVTGIFSALVIALASICFALSAEASTGKSSLGLDYDLWHEMGQEKISGDGELISYVNVYRGSQNSTHIDSVIGSVTSLRTGAKIEFSGGGDFSPDSKWYASRDGNNVGLLNTTSGEVVHIGNAVRYEFSNNSMYFLVQTKSGDDGGLPGKLIIRDLNKSRNVSIENVESYSYNSEKNIIAYTTKAGDLWSLFVKNLMGAEAQGLPVISISSKISSLNWDRDGQNLAFLEEIKSSEAEKSNYAVNYYSNAGNKPVLRRFDPSGSPAFPSGIRVSPRVMYVSHKSQVVFFEISWVSDEARVKVNDSSVDEPDVQIWHSLDTRVISDKRRVGSSSAMLAWWPLLDRSVKIGGEEERFVALTMDDRHAITSSGRLQLFDGDQVSSTRYSMIDTFLGQRRQLISDMKTGDRRMILSPGGKYIGYFKNDAWWVYDIATDSHTNVTAGITSNLYDEDYDRAGWSPPYGSPGWTKGDGQMIIYDRYDIWLVAPDGTVAERITNGRERQITYRIHGAPSPIYAPDRQMTMGYEGKAFDLSGGVVLLSYGENTKRSGFSRYQYGGGLEDLVFQDALVDVVLPRNGGGYVYRRQRFDLPPELVKVDSQGKSEIVVARSNIHHSSFKWGRSELVDYVNSAGDKLQGALFYPSSYKPGKKYPMIVSIYERQSRKLHEYVNPSRSSYVPTSNWTNDGYFVFLPDISYGDGDPGYWALDAVTSAVNAVLDLEVVDPKAIGLTGASWGGYQTAYIVTRSNIFAAAVAGSAVTDLVSSYLSIEPGYGVPTLWRYELQQLRMHDPLHKAFDAYIRNSPVFNANEIETPLLSWFGGKDPMISSSQALEMYIIMRRMGKEHVLLLYPNEGHVISSDREATDLYERVKSWFDYYLKNEDPAPWITGAAH